MQSQTQLLSVYVVDQNVGAQDRYRSLFEAKGFNVLPCSSAEQFLELYDPQISAVMVLDFDLPQMSGAELQTHMIENGMHLPLIVATAQGSVARAVTAMRLGAIDFLEKPVPEERLLEAVRTGAALLFKKQPANVSKKVVADRLARLTDREREVLHYLLQGKLNKEIASELDVSQRTVEGHRSRIREKMNARGIADLIRMVG